MGGRGRGRMVDYMIGQHIVIYTYIYISLTHIFIHIHTYTYVKQRIPWMAALGNHERDSPVPSAFHNGQASFYKASEEWIIYKYLYTYIHTCLYESLCLGLGLGANCV